ncbi:RAB7A-interacting MON1-CCZ1 complex subunit 1 [Erpetoichthys calabaricus]|uniref:Rab7a interacting mon1-ccz1 complex subunit 1 n=1 Tax=Erpetoichthys calabaricus TaxID=27687 RepID=A0A8C4SCM3_ERPCA|nr:RAB7A-interacting MON1-CCZ1 complex subunit 1 [Erpetoichthys calabaricus]
MMAVYYTDQGIELKKRILQIENKCSSLSEENQEDDYLQNACATVKKLTNYYTQEDENVTLSKLLQDYTQVVLDVTFYEENKLVDQEFPEDISPQKIHELLQELTEPELLVGMLAGGQDVLAVLGKELLECLYWRRGALLYMYCYTLQQRKQWIKSNIPSFLKWLHEGVHFLMRMLQVKNSIQLSDGVVFHDSSTAKLLTEGVFSDTHLLTMMYIGEMCFWAVKYDDCDTSTPDRIKENLNFRDIGKQILSKYVTVCEGPLKGQGWNTENAKEILNFLQ